MTGQDVWYIARDGKQHGPLSELEMSKLVELGHLKAGDLIWKPGYSDWRMASEVFPMPQKVDTAPAAGPASRTSPGAQPRTSQGAAAAPSTQNWSQLGSSSASTIPAGGADVSARPAAAQPAASGRPLVVEPQRWGDNWGERLGQPQMSAPQGGPGGVSADRPRGAETRPAKAEVRTSGNGRSVGVALLLLAFVGAGSFLAYKYQDPLREMLSQATVKPGGGSSPSPSVAKTPEPPSTPVVKAATDTAPAAQPVTGEAAIDEKLQRTPLWVLLKSEFPDWYQTEVREIQSMTTAGKQEEEIARATLAAMIDLRRMNAEQALSASTPKLKEMADAFVENLKAMQAESVEACYGFISKGETTPAAVAALLVPERAKPLYKQLEAIFTAVAEGKRSPTTRVPPQKADYDLLATELGAIGWSQADIQLFADPKALSQAPKDQVCRMVQDWFRAHLSVKDSAAQERLLHETLRAVVAG